MSSCSVSSSTKRCPWIGVYPASSVPVTSTSVHYAISVHVWHSTLLNLLLSVSLAHVLIIATACSAARLSATLIVSNVCRTHSLVRSFRHRFAPVPLSFGGSFTGCRPDNVSTSSSALSRSERSTVACLASWPAIFSTARRWWRCTPATQSYYVVHTFRRTFPYIPLQPRLQWSGSTYLLPSMTLSA